MSGARSFSLAGLLCSLVSLGVPAWADSGLVYGTQFESFTVGADNWHGTEGWFANASSIGLSLHGIDDDKAPGLNKTAYLGFFEPQSDFTTIARTVNHDPAVEGTAKVRVDSLLGIEDSTNGRRDSFFVSFYNMTGDYLASIRFSNEPSTFGIWRDDGLTQTDTTVDFLHGELQLLFVTIDLINNTWTADIDGIPLFTKVPFTATSHPRTLGSVAYEWLLSSTLPSEYGNNWMLVADCYVWGVPFGEPSVIITPLGKSPSGQSEIGFLAEPGWTYRVRYSDDFHGWRADLEGSLFTGYPAPESVTFTDPTLPPPGVRFYRVDRSITP